MQLLLLFEVLALLARIDRVLGLKLLDGVACEGDLLDKLGLARLADPGMPVLRGTLRQRTGRGGAAKKPRACVGACL